ncbi:MAG: YdbH domain-containing protein, partial [Parvularculaceae bacterium]
ANLTVGAWRLGETGIAATGSAGATAITADAVVTTLVREATVGRLSILDAPVASTFRLEADRKAHVWSFFSDPAECLRMPHGRFRLAGQDSEAELTGARLCRNEAPLLVWRGGDNPHAEVKGRLTASAGSYRIGLTRLDGLPPTVDLEAQYDPRAQLTEVAGTMENGVVIVNGAIAATDARGTFSGRLDRAALSGEAALSRVTLAQNVKAPQLAPITATGTARLAAEKVDFNYSAATERGLPIGGGAGVHDVRRGVGRTTFRSGALVFAPRGLQPADIVSALKGIVSGAAGSASGEASFVWGRRPSDFRSSGAFAIGDLAFLGPGRAVNRTDGVSGKIVLTSLSPLKSDGEQTLTVKGVDMDALKLEQGSIRYALPGDGTVRISAATFPWFGGRIGAYDSTAALTGAAIDTALKAEDVDLGLLLDHLKIEGLSGEGVVEGTLPLKIVEGRARVVDGFFTAKGPGVIRYVGKAGDAAGSANKQARFAFDILRDLHFDELTARIDGPLDGDLNFNIVFKGANEVTVDERKVTSPVIYRISLEAPLLALIDQARISSDIKLQIERAGGTIEESE